MTVYNLNYKFLNMKDTSSKITSGKSNHKYNTEQGEGTQRQYKSKRIKKTKKLSKRSIKGAT